MAPNKIIHGDDLLYRFFEDALKASPELFASVPQLLITTMAVWLPLDTYERWPVLLPWVVRDPSCRGAPLKGTPDQWSAPNAKGYLRDDNSLVKSLPRALSVHGPKGSHIHGARMGSEFVASHVWRSVKHHHLASRIPLLNSFVPNVVWLPNQVAKLTDREGGVVQKTIQAMSYRIFRNAHVAPQIHDIAEEAWALIPNPALNIEPFELHDLNWFRSSVGFYRTRAARLSSVIEALQAVASGVQLRDRVVTRRYATGLPLVPPDSRSELLTFLQRFIAA